MTDGFVYVDGFPSDPKSPIIQRYSGGAKSVSDFYLEVKKGNVPGHTLIQKFGSCVYTGASGWKVISTSLTYPTPTALTSLEIVSDSIQDIHPDNGVGTGMFSVNVLGISTGWVDAEEIVKLNGTTAVPLSNQYYRNYRLEGYLSGTYASPGGSSHNSTITIRESGAGATWSNIISETGFGLGQSEIGVYTIAAGEIGYLMNYRVDVSDIGANKVGDIALFTRDNADDVTTPFTGVMKAKSIARNLASGSSLPIDPRAPILQLTGPADIGFMMVSASDAEIEVKFEIIKVTL